MTLTQFSILLHNASNFGKLTTIKRFKDLTGLRLLESKNILDEYGMYSENSYIVMTSSIKEYLRTLSDWKDIKSYIRKINFNNFVKEHNIIL